MNRSTRWPSTREAFLRVHPRCAVCPDTAAPRAGTLNVHHVVPFQFVVRVGRPDLELDVRNLITLCEGGAEHHLVVGHLGDWDSYNEQVRADVARSDCHGLPGREIEKLAWWTAQRASRPGPCALLSVEQRAQLKAQLDAKYPPVPQPQPEARP